MNKAVEILEKNVQWITLGLGAGFVAFTTWQYFVNTPTVDVRGTKLGAGQIDADTATNAAARLEEKLNSSASPRIDLPTFSQSFAQSMTGPTTQPLSGSWTFARPLLVDLPGADAPIAGGTTRPSLNPDQIATGVVSELKELPAAKPLGTSTGMSQVNQQSIVPVTSANAALFNPAAPVDAAVPVVSTDKQWVTASFEVPMDQLAAQFDGAKIPPGLTSAFLRVEIEREEMKPDGTWTNRTLIRPLTGSPLASMPLPAERDLPGETTYRPWAEANQVEILQPSFYSVLSGSQWTLPGQTAAPVVGAAFDPMKFLTGPIPPELSPEQVAAVRKARAEEAAKRAEEEKAKRKEAAGRSGSGSGDRGPGGRGGGGGVGGGGPGGGGGGGGRGGQYAPGRPRISMLPPGSLPGSPDFGPGGMTGLASINFGPALSGMSVPWLLLGDSFAAPNAGPESGALRTEFALWQPSPTRPPGYPPNLPWPPRGAGGEAMPYDTNNPDMMRNEAGMQPTQSAGPNLGGTPTGPFDPTAWRDGNVITFQHDETVQAGKTYRYRARYLVLNPIYQQPNAATKPELASQFRWASAWSEWTDSVQVAETVSFFVNKVTNGAATLNVEIFRFVGGRMRSKTVALSPGDLVAVIDPAGDFTTGYTVVDIRSGRGEGYALLMAPDGTLVRRDGSDLSTPRYRDLKNQASAAVTPVGSTGQ